MKLGLFVLHDSNPSTLLQRYNYHFHLLHFRKRGSKTLRASFMVHARTTNTSIFYGSQPTPCYFHDTWSTHFLLSRVRVSSSAILSTTKLCIFPLCIYFFSFTCFYLLFPSLNHWVILFDKQNHLMRATEIKFSYMEPIETIEGRWVQSFRNFIFWIFFLLPWKLMRNKMHLALWENHIFIFKSTLGFMALFTLSLVLVMSEVWTCYYVGIALVTSLIGNVTLKLRRNYHFITPYLHLPTLFSWWSSLWKWSQINCCIRDAIVLFVGN